MSAILWYRRKFFTPFLNALASLRSILFSEWVTHNCQITKIKKNPSVKIKYQISKVKCHMSKVYKSKFKCQMSNLISQMSNAISNVKRQKSNVLSQMFNVKCQMSNVKWSNVKSQMTNINVNVRSKQWILWDLSISCEISIVRSQKISDYVVL